MKNVNAKTPHPGQDEVPGNTKVNYSPKTYTLREQLASMVKLLAVTGAIGLLIWLMNAMTG